MENPFRRHALIFVLVFGCLLMSLLVAQQDRTINSQRTLIRQLLRDSLELSAMKVERVQAAAHR